MDGRREIMGARHKKMDIYVCWSGDTGQLDRPSYNANDVAKRRLTYHHSIQMVWHISERILKYHHPMLIM